MTPRYGFALLAPEGAAFHKHNGTYCIDGHRYRTLLSGMQALRGRTYLEDGAISLADVDAAGRFRLDDDESCWHILLTERVHEVIGCVRMRIFCETAAFEDMRVRHAALAANAVHGPRLRTAVEADLSLARREGLRYAEIGGWALAHAWRGTKAALDILAASYALGELLGGCIGLATATFRHESASILKKIGASPFAVDGEELPPYHDPRYGCMMQILRFTRTPVQRYALLVEPIRKALEQTPITVARSSGVRARTRAAGFSHDLELIREVA